MKRFLQTMFIVAVFFAFSGSVVFAKGGYNEWGYNYQANIFNGTYCDAYQDAAWCQPYKDVKLQMKWNDAWLNEDKVRHEGYDSYVGSGAWLTNHQAGTCELDGKTKKWNYFVKIAAIPEGAYVEDGNFFTEDGVLLGEPIWGSFYIGMQVSNDPCSGDHGMLTNTMPGLGNLN